MKVDQDIQYFYLLKTHISLILSEVVYQSVQNRLHRHHHPQ